MQCQICNKSGMTGNNVSHSNRKTKTRWKANVHKQTLAIDGKPTRVKDLLAVPADDVQAAPGQEGQGQSGAFSVTDAGPVQH